MSSLVLIEREQELVAYYNENDPYAAAWLRNLIAAGRIPWGYVDERDIRDVTPADLAGYSQCHFFAGIGGWPLALALASVPADRPLWTGSCPCQPFSAAGKGGGFDDERHLWPDWFWLIDQCRPPLIFGEQVASKDGLGWLDLVQADLEDAAYRVAAHDLCAAGIGAPHIRQRLYFVADAAVGGQPRAEQGHLRGCSAPQGERSPQADRDAGLGDAGGVAHPDIGASGQGGPIGTGRDHRSDAVEGTGPGSGSLVGGLADADGRDASAEGLQRGGQHGQQPQDGGVGALADTDTTGRGVEWGAGLRRPELYDADGRGSDRDRPGPTNGVWRDADWLLCRDGKWRPVEPGTFPLAHGVSARVGRLRAYGNAIVPPLAAEFIKAYLDC